MEGMEQQGGIPSTDRRPFGDDAIQANGDANMPMGERLLQSPETEATEEEQAQYDLIVSRAIKFMHGNGKKQVLKMLGSGGRPAEVVGNAAASIAKSIKISADEAGKPLDDSILFHAGTEIVEELTNLGREAGVFEFSSDEEEQKEVEEGFLYALKKYGETGLEDGTISDDAVNQSKAIMQQGIESEAKYGNPAVKQSIQQAMAGGAGGEQQAAPQGPIMRPGLINNAIGG